MCYINEWFELKKDKIQLSWSSNLHDIYVTCKTSNVPLSLLQVYACKILVLFFSAIDPFACLLSLPILALLENLVQKHQTQEKSQHNMSYNITAWNSDDAHLSRFAVNTTSGALLFLHALSLMPVVLWRKSYFPVRAHGLFFVLARLCGVMLIGAYFASFMPLNRMWISLYLCFLPLAYLFPTLQRYLVKN